MWTLGGVRTAAALAAIALAAATSGTKAEGLGRPAADATFSSHDACGCMAAEVRLFVRGGPARDGLGDSGAGRVNVTPSRTD